MGGGLDIDDQLLVISLYMRGVPAEYLVCCQVLLGWVKGCGAERQCDISLQGL